ncbi:MAG: hypothetical protein WCP20_17610 [Desulfuromonadales bacterium]
MAKEMQNLAGLITGTLKIIEPTEKRDSSKRVVWKAVCCFCGGFEYSSKPVLEKLAGHSVCTGHPAATNPVEGFHLHPDNKETPEHAAAVAAWESRRHPEQPKVETDKPLSTEGSAVLRDRLKLDGYCCETVLLPQAIIVSGSKAEKVIFAKSVSTANEDRVFLHVQLCNDAGKRSIISSRSKIAVIEWNEIASSLAGMNIIWRDRR